MSTIIKPLSILLILFTLGSVALLGCQQGGGGDGEVTFEQLFSDPEQYNGKTITIDGFYFHGFEVIVLSEVLEYSGYAEGHLIPEGRMMWVEGGIPVEVYDQLYEQQMMGPTERYGKIRVKGKFAYGGQYGHVGAYSYQITPAEVELLPWSPPEE